MALEMTQQTLARDGLRYRKAVRRTQQEFEDQGIPWETGQQIIKQFGVPGDDASTQADWIVCVQAWIGPQGFGSIDWNSLIQALLPLLLGLCPK